MVTEFSAPPPASHNHTAMRNCTPSVVNPSTSAMVRTKHITSQRLSTRVSTGVAELRAATRLDTAQGCIARKQERPDDTNENSAHTIIGPWPLGLNTVAHRRTCPRVEPFKEGTCCLWPHSLALMIEESPMPLFSNRTSAPRRERSSDGAPSRLCGFVLAHLGESQSQIERCLSNTFYIQKVAELRLTWVYIHNYIQWAHGKGKIVGAA